MNIRALHARLDRIESSHAGPTRIIWLGEGETVAQATKRLGIGPHEKVFAFASIPWIKGRAI